jgi:hypothetical protein
MAKEEVGIEEEMTIKKETVDEKGDVVERLFFFPKLNKSVKAASYEEALKKIGKKK